MQRKSSNRKKILYLLTAVLLVVIITATAATVISSAAADSVFTFTSTSIKEPMYVKEYFTSLPRAYEAEVNFPEGTYSSESPIISNYPNNDTRGCFGFKITKEGNPTIYYCERSYDSSTNKTTSVSFDYDVIGKGWVRLTAVNEKASDGNPVYKLYVNGELTDTIATETVYHNIDAVYSQSTTRELSFGSDGTYHFKGNLRNVAVYGSALTAEEAATEAKTHLTNKNAKLMAYYDATMSGNSSTFIKDQSGNGHDVTPAFFERKDELDDYAYSFAFVGDTQFLMYRDASQGKSLTTPIYDWIAQNKESKNIKYVLGLGDITDRDDEREWKVALDLHQKLTDADIPYAVIPGNHDDYTYYTLFNQYFGQVSAFTDNIDGYYQDGRIENYYMNFEVGEHKYMIVALQYGAPDEVLNWANSVVSQNPDRRVIVITHGLFDYNGNWSEPGKPGQMSATKPYFNDGIDIWNDFISQHQNIIIAAAGHVDPEHIKHGTAIGDKGNTVHTFLIDPQGLDKATDFQTGMVAMFYFSEDGNDVQVEYVSTTKTLNAQKSNSDSDDILFHENNQFSFTINEQPEIVPDYSGVGNINYYIYAMPAGGTSYKQIGTASTFRNALGVVRDSALGDTYANAAYKGGKAWIYANPKNIGTELPFATDKTKNNWNFGDTINGELIIDLGGNTISLPAKENNHLIGIYTTTDTTTNFTTSIKIMNGAIITAGSTSNANDRSVIRIHGSKSAFSGTKKIELEFENVAFSSANANTPVPIVLATDEGSYLTSKQNFDANVTFDGCTFDFATSSSFSVVQNLVPNDSNGKDNVDVDVTLKGECVITPPKADSKIFVDTKGNNDTANVHANTTIILPYTEQAPTVSFETVNGTMHLASRTETVSLTGVEYGLSNIYIENLGYIPNSEYGSNFSVFSDTGYHIGSYNSYYNALNRATIVLKNASGGIFNQKTVTMYMHNDYVNSGSNYNNLAQIDGKLVIDLGGNTLTHTKNYLFDVWAKGMNNLSGKFFLPETKITVKNGAIIMNSDIARISGTGTGTNFLYSGNKVYDFTFTNISFENEGGKSLFFVNAFDNNENKKFLDIDVSFSDCTFNTAEATLLNFALDDNVLADVTLSGCIINTEDMNSVTILSKSEGKTQSLVLDMSTTLNLPEGAAAPSYDTTYSVSKNSDVEYVFVKASCENGTETYVLKEKELATFVPKSSITLSSTLVYNIYVPVSSALTSLTLDGKEYTNLSAITDVVTLSDGRSYYLFKIELKSASAAKDIILNVSLTIGEKTYNGRFTMSIPKYATQILNDGPNDEKELVLDVLAYIKSAYVYFNPSDKDSAIEKIDAVLGNYEKEFAKTEGTSDTSSGLYGAKFILDENPILRFYLAKGKTKEEYTFKYGNKVLEYKTYGSTEIDGVVYNYVDISLYAYQLSNAITYTCDIGNGSYHINSYYDFVTTSDEHKNNTNLITLVEKLYNYVLSAEEFRAAKTGN